MLRGTMRQWDNTEVERAKGPMWRILGLGAAASTLTRPWVGGRTIAAGPDLPIACSRGYVGERLRAKRSVGSNLDLIGELVYGLQESRQVVENSWRKTRRRRKPPETEAENRVGIVRASPSELKRLWSDLWGERTKRAHCAKHCWELLRNVRQGRC